MKRIAILGSTGSIGTQTLDVIKHHPNDFKVVALAANGDDELVEKQAREFGVERVALTNEDAAERLRKRLKNVDVISGPNALSQIATHEKADTVVTAVVGAVGVKPTIDAIRAGKNVALANKETLVAAGGLVMSEVKKHGVKLTPIDSEHCALFQCLNGENAARVKKLILTCSGGPFRDAKNREELEKVTVEGALNHPTWKMGGKITIDSATLMNKGLEVIEAHWLYGVPYDKIDVVIHPQSIVHSAIEFVDHSIMAQMGNHDMRLMIQYALSHPERLEAHYPGMDLAAIGVLNFDKPKYDHFPCLSYAYESGKKGGTVTAVMNAANEIAVAHFLAGKIGFMDIPRTIRHALDTHVVKEANTLEAVLEADAWSRAESEKFLSKTPAGHNV
ncbi:MAG TPA: 1-deoxy-D-xylulose-5-phosphate reductoisomerase [Candidatus Norongarragalinales archaeon]|jgi:1-deoxy-D-xylulose-5-phosphate reductoisomerase|nr:1-deoxy-D-xylulose-5-phosphate reductoisomerase [Candidatus Norongarragalinales archaeon]